MICVTWTDPATGQRELRTFETADGLGGLLRALRRSAIPHGVGSAIDAATVATLWPIRSRWQPDPRVWSSFRRNEGTPGVEQPPAQRVVPPEQ